MLSKVSVAAAATVAFLLASPVSAFPSDCTRNYTVVAGDVCDSISAAHNVSTYQLAVVNYGTIDATCSNLMPGEVICLGTTGEDCTTTHTVASGDTCSSIENTFAINSTLLEQNNPQINEDCSNIYGGEVLCVASTVLAPPTPSGFFSSTTATPAPAATGAIVSNSGGSGGDGSDDSDNSYDDTEWVPTQPGDDGYSDDLPICGDD